MRNKEIDFNLNFEKPSLLHNLVGETFHETESKLSSDVFQSNGKLNASLLFKNAKILLLSGDTKLARNIFHALIERGEMLGQSYAGLAVTLELEGKIDLAIKAFREAIIYDPAFSSLLGLAELFIKKEEYQNAIGTLLRANNVAKISSSQAFTVHKSLGNCYMHLGQLNNAESHYRQAYEINSNSDVLHVNIGGLALRKGDLATALLHFREAIRIKPQNASAQTGVGLAQLGQGNRQSAHDAFAQALRIDIHDANALFNLVKCAYELRQFETASELIQEYIKSNTVNSNILYSYAGILYHRGMYKESLEECDKLLSFNASHDGAKKIKELISQKTN